MASEPPFKAPPYASYTSFKNYLDHLRGKPLPSRIDKSVMAHLNYGTQQALMAALRSLALIGDGDVPTTSLELLVDASEDDRAGLLLEAVKAAYPYLFDSRIDLGRATQSEFQATLHDATRAQGSTASKATSFFYGIASDAGVDLSPHLTSRKGGNGSAPKRTKPKARKPKLAEEQDQRSDRNAQGARNSSTVTDRLMDKFPQFDPAWPDPIKEKWFAAFEKLMKSADKVAA